MTWIVFSGIFAALYGFKFTHDPVSLSRTITKFSATFCLCLAGIMLDAPFVVVLGMMFGALGDAFLSRERAVGFLPGLAAFLCGHLIYVFWAFGQLDAVSITLLQSGAIGLLFMCTIFLVRRWWPSLGALKLPVLLYAIVSTCLAATGIVLLGQGVGIVFALGVFIFVVSDIVLAEQLFVLTKTHPKYKRYSTTLWGLYWSGQLSILLGSLSFVGEI